MRSDSEAASDASSRSDALIGRLIDDRYRINRRIARGGMAGVYEAHDERLDRIVALKVMHQGMGDEDAFAERFVREARAAAKLTHPNVVSIYDQGEDAGTVYLAMEMVTGHTLRDAITANAPLSPAVALQHFEPVLSALAAAHATGIVHRDIKPENVLIADSGSASDRVKVADFGLARAVSTQTQHTSSGMLIGTVSYIAPELVVDGQADARADVYSAGVLLYEMLTGEKPHAGETPIQVAYKHVHEDVPPPSAVVPGIPDYVDALVARATARDRDLRPSDASVLLHQVHRVRTALNEGLTSDDELTSDLVLPPPVESDGATEATVAAAAPPPTAPPPPRTTTSGGGAEHTTVLQASPTPRPRRRGRPIGLIAILASIALVVAIGVAGWWFIDGRYTRTPALVGLTKAEATERLTNAGLEVTTSRDYSETIKKGQVMASDPGRGRQVLNGGTVEIVISRGVEEYKLPKFRGTSLAETKLKLDELGMTIQEEVERWHEKIPKGDVIRTDPKAGTVLRAGSSVRLFVSQGREPIEIRDWTGQRVNNVASQLRESGVNVEIKREFSDDVPPGRIISQDPQDGTVYRGDTVTLTASEGFEMTDVPSVFGRQENIATRILRDAGFNVDVKSFPFGGNRVVQQNPSGGQAQPGSVVTIWLG